MPAPCDRNRPRPVNYRRHRPVGTPRDLGPGPVAAGELGWKSLGILELTALPSIDEAARVPAVRDADALLVRGGDPLFLAGWMRLSGLAETSCRRCAPRRSTWG